MMGTAFPSEARIIQFLVKRLRVRRPSLAWLVLALGVVSSVFMAGIILHLQKQKLTVRFHQDADAISEKIDGRIQAYGSVLMALRGLFWVHPDLTQGQYRDYLEYQDLAARYPGFLGVTYGVHVKASERPAYEARMRRELGRLGDGRSFSIFPEGERSEYCVVVYGFPERENRMALGFDTWSSPIQRESLERARDTGRLSASAPMPVVQDPRKEMGLILRLATYRPGALLGTVPQRREAFVGYVNAVFRVRDLVVQSVDEEALRQLEISLKDLGTNGLDAPRNGAPFFTNRRATESPAPHRHWLPRFLRADLTTDRYLDVGGRRWRLHIQAGRDYAFMQDHVAPTSALAGGLLVSFLLFGLVHSVTNTGAKARELALRMTEKLRDSESRLRAIARVIPDLLLVMDEDGRYVEVYASDEGLLVVPRPELVGHGVQERLSPEYAQMFLSVIRRALETGEVQSTEYDLDVLSGRCRFEARVVDLGVEIDGKRCVVWVSRDITERVRSEEQLRHAQKLESLGVLAGGIAHDFNNILTAILGNLNLAQNRIGEADPSMVPLNRAEAAVLRAADLAKQMLAYSGRGRFSIVELDLNRLVADMTGLIGVSVSKKIALRFQPEADLPLILADAAQVQQVVLNLVSNASDAIGDAEGSITINTSRAELDVEAIEELFPNQEVSPGSFVLLSVSDTGCGMEPELVARIFDPFFSTKGSGRGLGLSAMHGILRGHHAGIHIQSEPGRGSTFRVYFPASDASLVRMEDKTDPGLHEYLSTHMAGNTILIVDDEPGIRESVKDLAEQMCMNTLEARDGHEAVEVFKEHRDSISVILLDLTMPRMDGNEAFHAIRMLDAEVPVILSSGFTDRELAAPMVGKPALSFVQKPYRLSELRKAIARALMQGRSGSSGRENG